MKYILCFFLLFHGLLAPPLLQAQDDGLDLLNSFVDLMVTIDEVSLPLEKAINQEYNRVLECQSVNDYALLLEETDYDYQRVRKRYLKKKQQKDELLDRIAYIDRFNNHVLPNEIVPGTLSELQRVIQLVQPLEKDLPQALVELLQFYRFQLEIYQLLEVRPAEVALALQKIDQLQNQWINYQQSEDFALHQIAQRSIAPAHLQDPPTEAAIRTQIQQQALGTPHLIHLQGAWTPQQTTAENGEAAACYLSNYGQATITGQDGSCYLLYFDVKKPCDPTTPQQKLEVKPYKYDPMQCSNVTKMP